MLNANFRQCWSPVVRWSFLATGALAAVAFVSSVAAATPTPSPSASTTPTTTTSATVTAATSPPATSSASPTPSATACNGELLNGFLILHDNELPNAFCPDFAPVTAAGPYTIYGLDLPTGQYSLVSAGHPANSPDVTTITYVPNSGVTEGEGYITVSVTRTYKKPSFVNIPPGGDPASWTEARYLPEPGVANTTAGQSTAEWFGPGGLYTISIDSAHSSLTLEQAAALLVPVNLDELQASLTLTATVTPQAPPTGNGPVHEGGSDNEAVPVFVAGIGALLLAAAAILIIQKRRVKDRE